LSGLYYTVSSSDHRIQYQSFEIPLEYDTTISQDSLGHYSVLNAAHKHFIPPSNQQCQIPLEEDVLVEIFLIKTKRGKSVIYFQRKIQLISSIYLFRKNYVIFGLIHFFLLIQKCNLF